MRNRFDRQLYELHQELITMGSMCEDIISCAAKGILDVKHMDEAKLATLDEEIDQKERDIEALCLKLLLQQQPVARDLRQISAALKMITDMERIGDQAMDIAEICHFLEDNPTDCLNRLGVMAEAVIKMVTDSVEAYVKADLAMAQEVIAFDDKVDEDFVTIKKLLIKEIADNREEGEHILDLLMIAKYFERIGDHATNIAEWVEFSITGVHEGEEK